MARRAVEARGVRKLGRPDLEGTRSGPRGAAKLESGRASRRDVCASASRGRAHSGRAHLLSTTGSASPVAPTTSEEPKAPVEAQAVRPHPPLELRGLPNPRLPEAPGIRNAPTLRPRPDDPTAPRAQCHLPATAIGHSARLLFAHPSGQAGARLRSERHPICNSSAPTCSAASSTNTNTRPDRRSNPDTPEVKRSRCRLCSMRP
jgi:hypothetical protein